MRNNKTQIIKPFIFLLLLSNLSFSQDLFTKINMKHVEKEIGDKMSKFYYPHLIERFQSFDSTLTMEDYRMIYYGFAFNKNFSAYEDHRTSDVKKLMESSKYLEAIKTCDSIIEKTPISLRANYLKGYCLFKLNNDDPLSDKYRSRYRNLIKSIISTGDGLDCKTGFKALYVGDEYEVIYNYFEVEKFEGQALVGSCDVLNIEPTNKFKAKSIYFDITEMLKKEAELFNKK